MITSHNQQCPSLTKQYLIKKYSDYEFIIGCHNFFFKWNPSHMEDSTPNVQRLFKHMDNCRFNADHKHMELMNYLFRNRKFIKEIMSDIDTLEDLIRSKPTFTETSVEKNQLDEDEVYDQLEEEWNGHWMSSYDEEPLVTLWVNFIEEFFQHYIPNIFSM